MKFRRQGPAEAHRAGVCACSGPGGELGRKPRLDQDGDGGAAEYGADLAGRVVDA